MEVDVAVVGGGPAGSAAAYFLAKRGHSVLVCEKKRFPREKTCGDGLTPRAVKMLEEMGLGDRLGGWERVHGLRVHARGKTHEIPLPKLTRWCDYGLVRARKDLDREVLDNAQRAGAKVLSGTRALEPVFDRGAAAGVLVERDGQREKVEARWIVCAEGAATRIARALGREREKRHPMGIAVRQYFRSSLHRSGWFDIFLDLYLGRNLIAGYGWVFPMGDGTVNAGVGLLNTSGMWSEVNLRRLQEAFVGNLSSSWEVRDEMACGKPRAARLFMGGSVWPPHGPGFLLAGDAAGAINPCSGEGIAYGYETGRIAAAHIDEALGSGNSASLHGYTEELEQTYGPYYRLGRGFAKLIAHPHAFEPLVSIAMQSRGFMSFLSTLLLNLEDPGTRDPKQKGFRLMKWLAGLGG